MRRAFAIDSDGHALPGWPVDIGDAIAGRMIGQELRMIERPYQGDLEEAPELARLLILRADGGVARGNEVSVGPCCESTWAVGPNGMAYGTFRRGFEYGASVKTDVVSFDLDGTRAGWPVTVDGNTSELAFDRQGQAYLVVGWPNQRPARTVVLDASGVVLPTGSADQPIVSTSTWNGAGADYPGPPIVAVDGTSFIVSTEGDRTTVIALDTNGQPRAGWPYRSSLGIQWTGFCGVTDSTDGVDVGCGQSRTSPQTSADNVLHLLNGAASSSSGGSVVAIGPSGKVRAGWPVGLRRAGSMFWSIAIDPIGGIWALAIEPETPGYSATILSIATDSTVRFTTTIVEP
jgi:hypothetical protein